MEADPDYSTGDFYHVALHPIERIFAVHHRLLCKIVSCWPDGFRPFDTEEFQPIETK